MKHPSVVANSHVVDGSGATAAGTADQVAGGGLSTATKLDSAPVGEPSTSMKKSASANWDLS